MKAPQKSQKLQKFAGIFERQKGTEKNMKMCRLHIFNIIVYFNFLLINKNKYYCIKKIYKKLIIYKKNVKCHKKAPKKKSHFSNFFKIFFRFFFFQNLISKYFLKSKKKFFHFWRFFIPVKSCNFCKYFF